MQAVWYFDYLSPYPYLQMARFRELPETLEITPRPVLFPVLLNHWGHKGPAEIPKKALQTYRITKWTADRRGVPFVGPPRHPFNPLALLRLTIALGPSLDLVRTVYEHVWGEGHDGQSDESLAALGEKLGVADVSALTGDASAKATLKSNTEEAIERGVYGVPTFFVGGELFWGDDATGMMADFLADPGLFRRPEYARILDITPAAQRTPK